jgi:hypothetical protein
MDPGALDATGGSLLNGLLVHIFSTEKSSKDGISRHFDPIQRHTYQYRNSSLPYLAISQHWPDSPPIVDAIRLQLPAVIEDAITSK